MRFALLWAWFPWLIAAQEQAPTTSTLTTTSLASSARPTVSTRPSSSSAKKSLSSNLKASRVPVFTDRYHNQIDTIWFKESAIYAKDVESLMATDPLVVQIPMTSKETGLTHMFLCRLPKMGKKPLHSYVDEYLDQEIETQRTFFALKTLDYPDKKCFEYTQGYWSYEFCPKKHVKQYLKLAHKPHVSIEYYLGYYGQTTPEHGLWQDWPNTRIPADSRLVEIDSNGKRYLKQSWGNGDICDVSGKNRTIQIQYHCCTREHIALIREYTICSYVLVMHTPRMCGMEDVFYERKKPKAPSIVCEQIIDSPMVKHVKKESIKKRPRLISILDLDRFKCISPISCTIFDELEHTKEEAAAAAEAAVSRTQSTKTLKTVEQHKKNHHYQLLLNLMGRHSQLKHQVEEYNAKKNEALEWEDRKKFNHAPIRPSPTASPLSIVSSTQTDTPTSTKMPQNPVELVFNLLTRENQALAASVADAMTGDDKGPSIQDQQAISTSDSEEITREESLLLEKLKALGVQVNIKKEIRVNERGETEVSITVSDQKDGVSDGTTLQQPDDSAQKVIVSDDSSQKVIIPDDSSQKVIIPDDSTQKEAASDQPAEPFQDNQEKQKKL